MSTANAVEKISPKVVILGYFENSKDYGEKGYWGEATKPGELYYWIKGLQLTNRIKIDGAFNQVWSNRDNSIIALKIGPNSLHPAVNVTALGLDQQFDFSQSYWIINGIAGASPKNATIGDIVWADYIVNGDVAHEIDAREIPEDWKTGYFPAGSTHPYPSPRGAKDSPEHVANWDSHFHTNRSRTVFQLNKDLTQWAFQLTKSLQLTETETIKQVRNEYTQNAARKSATVKIGSTLSSETFWVGAMLDSWAHDWVSYMTDQHGQYVTTSTNDAGTMVALSALAMHHKVNPDRILLMRGVSNFDMPPKGISAAEQLQRQGPQEFAGYIPALEGLYQVGSTIALEIVNNWPKYQ